MPVFSDFLHLSYFTPPKNTISPQIFRTFFSIKQDTFLILKLLITFLKELVVGQGSFWAKCTGLYHDFWSDQENYIYHDNYNRRAWMLLAWVLLSVLILRGRGFEPHRRHCVVSLSKNINPSLVLVQPRKTRPFITERLLMGRKE